MYPYFQKIFDYGANKASWFKGNGQAELAVSDKVGINESTVIAESF